MMPWMEIVAIMKMMAEKDAVVLGKIRGETYHSHQEGQPSCLGRTRSEKAAVNLCSRPVLYAARHPR